MYAEETREVGAFDGIEVAGDLGIRVTVTGAGGARRVVVSGDANLIDRIESDVTGGVLRVSVAGGFEYVPTIPMQATISVPALSSIEAKDASSVVVKPAGGATLTPAPLTVVLRTAALDATSFPVTSATVDLSGSGSAKLYASGEISGSVADQMTLINVGSGDCNVTTSGTAKLSCD